LKITDNCREKLGIFWTLFHFPLELLRSVVHLSSFLPVAEKGFASCLMELSVTPRFVKATNNLHIFNG
jgi:hypothetical protein